MAGVDRVANAREVRRLCKVVAAAARPHEHIVGDVARERVGLLLRRGEDAPEGGNVLVIPRVAVGDRGALRDAGNLVAIVPPRHDARVLGGVVPQPEVGLAVVVDHHKLAVLQLPTVHDLRLARALGELVGVAIEGAAHAEEGKHHRRADAQPDGRCALGHELRARALAGLDHRRLNGGGKVAHLLDERAALLIGALLLAKRGDLLFLVFGTLGVLLDILLLVIGRLAAVGTAGGTAVLLPQLHHRSDDELIPSKAERDTTEGGGDRPEEDDQARHL